MAFVTRCLDLHFVRSDRQRVIAGFSQPQHRCLPPRTGALCFCFQSRRFGHPHPLVILRGLTGSRVAAETGSQPGRYHSLFDLNPGIRRGLHIDHLRFAGSHYDSSTAGRRVRNGLCCRAL